MPCINGGRYEIRTHGAITDTPTFQAGGLNHSPNLPRKELYKTNIQKTAFDTTYDTTFKIWYS
jgi:hypothetical protein